MIRKELSLDFMYSLIGFWICVVLYIFIKHQWRGLAAKIQRRKHGVLLFDIMTTKQLRNLIIHKDSFMLVFSLVFLWFSISLYVDSSFKISNMINHTGRVEHITNVITKVKNKLFFKETTRELQLKLNTEEDYFTSITTKSFKNIVSGIKVGDTVTIFTKPKIWGIFGLKRTRDISQLTKNGTIVINYATYKRRISGLFILTFIFSFILFIVYFVRINKRYHLDIVGDTWPVAPNSGSIPKMKPALERVSSYN